jgi:hypothetical protein
VHSSGYAHQLRAHTGPGGTPRGGEPLSNSEHTTDTDRDVKVDSGTENNEHTLCVFFGGVYSYMGSEDDILAPERAAVFKIFYLSCRASNSAGNFRAGVPSCTRQRNIV